MIRPLQHLLDVGRRYPMAWRELERCHLDRGRAGLPEWPEWCYVPMAMSFAIGEATGGPMEAALGVADIAALGAWRVTQGIYRYDPDLYAAIIDTPISRELPVALLRTLPEWCVYIETPGLFWVAEPLHGFFAHLEWDAATGEREELRMLLDVGSGLVRMPVHLIPGADLETSVRASRAVSIERLESAGGSASDILPATDIQDTARDLTPLISLLLYLCSDEPDLVNHRHPWATPANPRPKKTKKGPRLFPADGPSVWETGYRVGARLRQAATSGPGAGSHDSPRPHVRRAHWHTFWAGPRSRPEERRMKLRWLSPILVGVGNVDELRPTIKTVAPSG